MTVIEVTNETPAVLECNEDGSRCWACKHNKYCLLQDVKKINEIPKLFDMLSKLKIKFLTLLKGDIK